jgi:hypothetical protein
VVFKWLFCPLYLLYCVLPYAFLLCPVFSFFLSPTFIFFSFSFTCK